MGTQYVEMKPYEMDLGTFLNKYDNGEGLPFANNNKIHDSEVMAVGGYDQLLEDFGLLSLNSRKIVAKYFRGNVAYELLNRIDYRYSNFRTDFDGGWTWLWTIPRNKNNDLYYEREITRGGGMLAFKAALTELAPLAQEVIMARMDAGTCHLLSDVEKNPAGVVWKTFDNGEGTAARKGDKLIEESEIKNVKYGWEGFIRALQVVRPKERKQFLDSLTSVPGEDLFSKLKETFPDYTDRFNLQQFPKARNNIYPAIHNGLNMLIRATSRTFDTISTDHLPPFGRILAVTPDEQFYIDLYDLLQKAPAGYIMDIHEFASFVSEKKYLEPRATVEKLNKALRQEDHARYANVTYTMKLTGIALGQTKKTKDFTPLGLDRNTNANIIKKLKRLEIPHSPDPGMPGMIVFEMPQLEADYYAVVADSIDQIGLRDLTLLSLRANLSSLQSKVMVLRYNKKFPQYDVNLTTGKLSKNSFSERLFADIFLTGADLRVKPAWAVADFGGVLGDLFGFPGGNILLAGGWYLRPDFPDEVEDRLIKRIGL